MYFFYCEQYGTLNYLGPLLKKFDKNKINYKIFCNFDIKKKNHKKISINSKKENENFFLELKKKNQKK
jgi:hypothetical protein